MGAGGATVGGGWAIGCSGTGRHSSSNGAVAHQYASISSGIEDYVTYDTRTDKEVRRKGRHGI